MSRPPDTLSTDLGSTVVETAALQSQIATIDPRVCLGEQEVSDAVAQYNVLIDAWNSVNPGVSTGLADAYNLTDITNQIALMLTELNTFLGEDPSFYGDFGAIADALGTCIEELGSLVIP